MTWNHRIIKTDDILGDVLAIHEVYYNEEGEINAWTINPVCPYGQDLEDMKLGLDLMMTALEKPILKMVVIDGKEGLVEDE